MVFTVAPQLIHTPTANKHIFYGLLVCFPLLIHTSRIIKLIRCVAASMCIHSLTHIVHNISKCIISFGEVKVGKGMK